MTVVHAPDRRHECGPNRYGYWLNHHHDLPGTVRECACGKSWVAWKDHSDPGFMGVKWRREGWWARRRRLRNRRSVTGRESS